MNILEKLLKPLTFIAIALIMASCDSGATLETPKRDKTQQTSGKVADAGATKSRAAAGAPGADKAGSKTASSAAATANGGDSGTPTYKIATLEYFPPFVMRDELRNSTGFDVDILTAIGKKEGFVPLFVPLKWDNAFTSLDEGQRDILASGISILPERQLNYDFSDPYLTSTFAALCIERDGSRRHTDFKSLFNDPSLRFVTQKNSAGETKLMQLSDSDLNNILLVDSQYDEVRQVIQNNADVALDISRVLSYYIGRYPENKLYLLPDPDTKINELGFAVKKGNKALLRKLNDGLRKIKADGTYDKIYKNWFGDNEL